MIGAMHGSSSSSSSTSVGTPGERNSATTLMTFSLGRMNLTAAKLVFWQIPDLGSMDPSPTSIRDLQRWCPLALLPRYL